MDKKQERNKNGKKKSAQPESGWPEKAAVSVQAKAEEYLRTLFEKYGLTTIVELNEISTVQEKQIFLEFLSDW